MGQEPTEQPPGQEPTTPNAPAAPQDGGQQTFDAAYVRQLREENAARRKREDELQARLSAMEQSQLTDAEKREARLKELEGQQQAWAAERQQMLTRAEVERLARRAGVVDEEAAWRLLDAGAIAYGADGQPTNVAELLDALLKARPWLKGQPAAPTGGSPASPGGGRASVLTRDMIRQMTPEQINARWDEVRAVIGKP